MHSIRGRFALLTLFTTVLLAILIGAVSMFALRAQAENDARLAMNAACAYEAAQIDTVLEGTEDAVNIAIGYVQNGLLNNRNVKASGAIELSGDQVASAQSIFETVAENTEGSLLYFMSLVGHSASGPTGFARWRANTGDAFSDIPVTNLRSIVEGQGESIGYDEGLLRSGEALWLDPVNVDDMGLFVAVYMRPIFANGTYVGAVGMGVDFQIVIDQVAAMSSYKTGYGFLTDADGNVMYHPVIPYGTNLSEDDDDVPAVDAAIAAGTTVDIVSYAYQGANKRMAFHLLQNNMRLVLSVDASEIYAQRDFMLWSIAGVTIGAAVVFAAISWTLGRRALEPLNALTASAQQVAAGHVDIEILSSDVEEISGLIDAYQQTVGNLREQLAYIDGLAHRDGLTGTFNKGAYDEMQQRLNSQIKARAAGEAGPAFSIAMFDVNNLKEINDTFGHMAGDEYLRIAANQLMKCFENCPVFRLGGDEFAAVLVDEDMDRLTPGMAHLQGAMRASAENKDPWRRISLAYGTATFDVASDTSVACVFERADAQMYQCKQRMKE